MTHQAVSQKILQYVEIDVDYCSLTYGVAPCQASLTNSPPTGTIKCFNTLVTCQDRPHFTNAPVTLRFAVPTNYLPLAIECIPSIKSIAFDPAQISLGKDLGQRATLTITFDDHRHSDTGAGFDKYRTERSYDPYSQGTFWGKFAARQPFVRGRPLRWIVGNTDQALAAMETRHFIIDSFSGPDNNGAFKIIAKDLLKLADGDRAQAPTISNGFLTTDITAAAASFILSPAGVGAEYPATGYVAIGGSEICGYVHTGGGTDTDAFTKLLLHMDHPSNGATFVADASPAAHGYGSVNGAGHTDTAQKEFGLSSLALLSAGSYVTFAHHADWEFGAGDFTIEWWERRAAAGASQPALARDGSTTFIAWLIWSDATNVLFHASSNGVSWDVANGVSFGAMQTGVWHHFAVTRSGTTFRLFRDGVQTNTFTSSASLWGSGAPFSIGRAQNTNYYNGYLDEVRISKGIARWTANFTPPAAPYPSGSGGTIDDTFGIVRGQLGTVATTHSAQDRVQWCLRYEAKPPDIIIADLLQTYAAVEPIYIPAADWAAEISAYLNRLYTATIAQPTSVNTLISELIEQAGLSMWWNDRDQEIGMLVLRGLIYTNYFFNEDNVVADTLQIAEQPDKRLSQVHTYFGQINPLTSLTDKANYRSASHMSDDQSEADYGSPAIKEIFSRWIPPLGRTVADRLGQILLGRFKHPPRKISFSSLRNSTTSEIVLANGYQVQGWPMQDVTGAKETVNVQVTRMRPNPDIIEIETEEVLYPVTAAEDLTKRNIIVDANNYNINLRTAHDLIYPVPTAGITVICTINAGVKVGSTSPGLRSFDVGDWPAGVEIILHIIGRIQGAGGDGGQYTAGVAGGPAVYTRYPIKLSCPGQTWGGGGGGGSGYYIDGSSNIYWYGGGGGAGYNPGVGGPGPGGAAGAAGNTEAGGAGGGYGGAGGGPGLAGAGSTVPAGPGFSNNGGGAAGRSIDGVSFCTKGTWDGTTFTAGVLTGDVRGPQVN